jgi:hypothetical protein
MLNAYSTPTWRGRHRRRTATTEPP